MQQSGPVRACASLLLLNSCLRRLSASAGCAPLRQLELPGLAPCVPVLQLADTSEPGGGGGLTAAAPSFEGSSVAAAQACLEQLRQQAGGKWAEKVLDALGKVGVVEW